MGGPVLHSEREELDAQQVGANRFLYADYGLGFPKNPVQAHIISWSKSHQGYRPTGDIWVRRLGGQKKVHPHHVIFRDEERDLGSIVMGRSWGVIETIHDFSHQLLEVMTNYVSDKQVKKIFLPMQPAYERTARALGYEFYGSEFVSDRAA